MKILMGEHKKSKNKQNQRGRFIHTYKVISNIFHIQHVNSEVLHLPKVKLTLQFPQSKQESDGPTKAALKCTNPASLPSSGTRSSHASWE